MTFVKILSILVKAFCTNRKVFRTPGLLNKSFEPFFIAKLTVQINSKSLNLILTKNLSW